MPVEHPQARLDSLCLAIKDGTHGTHRRTDSGIPLLSAKNITRDGRLEWDREDSLISESEYRAIHATFRLQREDLLLTIVGSLGRRALFDGSKVTFQRSVAYLRPDQAKTLPTFLYHALSDASYQRQLIQRSNATAQAGLYLGELSATTVPAPPLPEQLRIAQILDTLDEAIRKTEQVIAKLQQMKQGLLHDLLTRGIDENGELRDAERHPDQFKDSPLGRIPRGWEVRELGASVDILHGYAYDGAFFADRPLGPMLLTPGNFHREGGLYFTSTNTKWFAGKLPSGYILRGGDIVTVMTDLSPRTLILGSTVVLDEGQELLHNQRIGKVVAKSSADWDSTFLALQMSSDRFRRKVIAEATGTTVRHTSPGKMKANLVARPPLSEQAVSVGSVVSYGARIHFEASGLNKLRSLKQGLMEDLLTGRVRVKPEEAE